MQNQRAATPTHPCESWAKSAGYTDWAAALTAFKEGKVLSGPTLAIQSSAKTAIGMMLFMEESKKAGLHTYATEGGTIFVGRHENFPAELLAKQEQESSKMLARFASSQRPS